MYLCKEVEFASAFTFLYSIREGTPAAIMENQVPRDVAKKRFDKLIKVIHPISLKINRMHVGSEAEVLVENVSKNDPNLLSGRLNNNLLVHFKGDKNLIGEIVKIKIVDCKTFYLTGNL